MIKIIADSACDLPAELVAEYGILIMPMHICFGDDTYKDSGRRYFTIPLIL